MGSGEKIHRGAHCLSAIQRRRCGDRQVYNGYGYLPSAELCFDIGEWGLPQKPEDRTPPLRTGTQVSAADELAAKRKRAKTAIPAAAPFQPFFGLTVVSCERGDLRQSPQGIYLYSENGREEIVLPTDRSPRSLVLDELADALLRDVPPIHDGRWASANLEVCAAAIASSQSGRDVELTYQVPVPTLSRAESDDLTLDR